MSTHWDVMQSPCNTIGANSVSLRKTCCHGCFFTDWSVLFTFNSCHQLEQSHRTRHALVAMQSSKIRVHCQRLHGLPPTVKPEIRTPWWHNSCVSQKCWKSVKDGRIIEKRWQLKMMKDDERWWNIMKGWWERPCTSLVQAWRVAGSVCQRPPTWQQFHYKQSVKGTAKGCIKETKCKVNTIKHIHCLYYPILMTMEKECQRFFCAAFLAVKSFS